MSTQPDPDTENPGWEEFEELYEGREDYRGKSAKPSNWVTAVGVVNIIIGGMSTVGIACLLWGLLESLLSRYHQDMAIPFALGFIGTTLMTVSGPGILRRKPWGRWLAIIANGVCIVFCSLGYFAIEYLGWPERWHLDVAYACWAGFPCLIAVGVFAGVVLCQLRFAREFG